MSDLKRRPLFLSVFHQRNEPPVPHRLGDGDVAEADDSRPPLTVWSKIVRVTGAHDLHEVGNLARRAALNGTGSSRPP